jgi:hypothetical protein
MSDRNIRLDKMLADAKPEIAEHWQGCREAGLEEMTQQATDAVDGVVVDYFAELKALPEPADDKQILAVMKRLYDRLNALNEAHDGGLLETDERELLVPIFIDAAALCGIDPDNYDGEPGGEYRDF